MHYLIKNINDFNDKDLNLFFYKIHILKKNKINKLLKNKKKKSIIGELLLCNILKDKYNLDYECLDFTYYYFNKPYISNINNLFFNISHSNELVMCAVSENEIGVDIEKIRKTDINTISFFATENEKEYILKDKIEVYKRLFKIWVLKEAYFKMLGSTLFDMKSVEFIINDNVYCSNKNVNILLREYEDYVFAIVEKKKD